VITARVAEIATVDLVPAGSDLWVVPSSWDETDPGLYEVDDSLIEDPTGSGLYATDPVLDIKTASVTINDSWSPYVQATFIITTPAAIAELDPTVGQPRITVTLTQPGYTRTLDLALQRRRINDDGTTTLEACSDEIALHAYRRVADTILVPTTASLRELVGDVLAEIGATLDPVGGNGPVDTTSSGWAPGQKAWDFLAPMIQAAGLRLWCDEERVFHLAPSPMQTSGQIVVDYDGATMTAYSAEINRDSWFDAVVLTYKWTDSLGDQYTAYDTASEPGFTSVYAETREDTPYPGPGAAAALLRRYLTRGRTVPTTALSDYQVNPGMTALISTPESGDQAGWVTSVSWDESGLMQIDARDIVDITEHAWLYQPAGESWLDGPVGESWLDA
jgi:hypothetical protein